MKEINREYARIPTWALNALVNNDYTGLSEREESQIESFLWGIRTTCDSLNCTYILGFSDEEYFTWNPEFGLACTAVDCNILFVIPEDHIKGKGE